MNYIVLASLSMSVVGLFLIYVAASNVEPQELEIGDVTGELIGRTITTHGYIKTEKMNENGHMFLTLTDGKKTLQVPIFSSVMQHLDENSFIRNSEIRVTGVVDDYRSQIQVIPRKPEDVVLGGGT